MIKDKMFNGRDLIVKTTDEYGRPWYRFATDEVFKSVLIMNPDILKEMLDKMLKDDVVIENVSIKEVPYKSVQSKGQRLDLVVRLKSGNLVGVEVNSSFRKEMREKLTGYICDEFLVSLKKSDNYKDVKETIQINITFGLPKENLDKDEYYLHSPKSGEYFTRKIKIIEFNATNIVKKWYTSNRKSSYDFIVPFALGKEELEELSKEGGLMSKINKAVETVNDDPLFHSFMTKEEADEMDYNTDIAIARDEGHKDGLKDGKLETAKNMFKDKLPIETIAKYTNLTIDTIKSL